MLTLNPRTVRPRQMSTAASNNPFLVASTLSAAPSCTATRLASERVDAAEIPDWVYRRFDLQDGDCDATLGQ